MTSPLRSDRPCHMPLSFSLRKRSGEYYTRYLCLWEYPLRVRQGTTRSPLECPDTLTARQQLWSGGRLGTWCPDMTWTTPDWESPVASWGSLVQPLGTGLPTTLVSNHRQGKHLSMYSRADGGLPHSPSSELTQHTRAALSTGQNIAIEYESRNTNQEIAALNLTPG